MEAVIYRTLDREGVRPKLRGERGLCRRGENPGAQRRIPRPRQRDRRPLFADGTTDPDTGVILLGDVVICAKRAVEQAEQYGHSVEREFCFLSAHSTLHLLGYDHETELDEKIMRAKQTEILESLGITQ